MSFIDRYGAEMVDYIDLGAADIDKLLRYAEGFGEDDGLLPGYPGVDASGPAAEPGRPADPFGLLGG